MKIAKLGHLSLHCALLLAMGCEARRDAERVTAPALPPSVDAKATAPALFRNVAAEVGLDFVHVNGASEEYFFPEIVAGGVALFDYDNDGDLDAYFVQSGRVSAAATMKFPDGRSEWSNRLYRNQLVPDGALAFVDVTDTAGVGDTAYGMGAAVADIDNDGDQDLYVTNLRDDVLFINQGDGHFTRASAQDVTPVDEWSTSASFFDYDRDGALDLFVLRYVRVDYDVSGRCSNPLGQRDYCGPNVFEHLHDRLLKGDGKGGLVMQQGWHRARNANRSGLGVVAGDYDGDGWIDLYVANDGEPNQLWMNRGNGMFEELALMSGSAYNANGKPEASMGVTSADVDADGDLDLFMTHLKAESNTLYLNDGRGNFSDATSRFNLAGNSLPATGFGTRWFDADNDGDLDLFSANGGVLIEAAAAGHPYPYAQPNQLFLNAGDGRFVAVSADQPADGNHAISRGAAFGDVDNDGDVDILVANLNGAPDLLLADAPAANAWVSVRLRDSGGNRDAIGAQIGVERDGLKTLWRRVGTDGSYLSASDLRTHFGLGAFAGEVNVLVRWPDGGKERFANVQTHKFVMLNRGQGTAISD